MLTMKPFERAGAVSDPVQLARKLERWRLGSLELSLHRDFDKKISGNIQYLSLDASDERYLLGGSYDGSLVIFDLEGYGSQQPKRTYPIVARCKRNARYGHKFMVSCVEWYPHDHGLFCSGGNDGCVNVWDTNRMKPVESHQFPGPISQLHLSPVGQRQCLIAVAFSQSVIQLIDIRLGSTLHQLSGHKDRATVVQWSPRDENVLVTGGADGRLLIWDIRSGKSFVKSLISKELSRTRKPHLVGRAHYGSINGLKFSPDGLSLASFASEGRVRVWDAVLAREITRLSFPAIDNPGVKVVQLAISNLGVGDYIYVPHNEDIEVLCVGSGKEDAKLCGHDKDVNCCILRHSRQELLSAGNDRCVLAWVPKMDQAEEYLEHIAGAGVQEPPPETPTDEDLVYRVDLKKKKKKGACK